MIKSWTNFGLRINAILAFAYILLAASIVSQLVRDRISHAKAMREQSGLPRTCYWLVRYVQDLIKFVPLTFIVKTFVENEEPKLLVFQKVVFVFPFAYLPYLYCIQHLFSK